MYRNQNEDRKIIITNLPSFYKINLYNRINTKRKIFVIFTGDTADMRKSDFFSGKIEFDYISLINYSLFKKLKITWQIISKNDYKELIICNVNELTSWLCAYISPKNKNSTVVESSYHESTTTGFRGYLKRMFFRRVCITYASGKAQEKLARLLHFNGKIIKTKGVGIFNIVAQPPYKPSKEVINFIYVGRLSAEKNLKLIINVFNNLPIYKLHIIGYGPDEDLLKQISKKNIIFHGAVNNKMLPELYQSCDVFILPSIKEPWGLVVEEALNNGLPVIVSNKIGCAEEIVFENHNGLTFCYNNESSLIEKIEKITDIHFYNKLKKNISRMDFNKIAEYQVNSYL